MYVVGYAVHEAEFGFFLMYEEQGTAKLIEREIYEKGLGTFGP